jgi:multidrug resistance efflux pump
MTHQPSRTVRVGITVAIVVAALIAVLALRSRYASNPWTRHAVVDAKISVVSPRVSGPVVEIGFKSHQAVKKGDLLYRIDPVPFEGEVHLAHARLDQTLAELEVLDSQVVAAEAAVETADAGILMAEASVHQAEAAFEAARLRLERLEEVSGDAVAELVVDEARGMYGTAEAAVQAAESAVIQAKAAADQARADAAAKRAARGAPAEEHPAVREAKEHLHHAELHLSYTEIVAPVEGHVSEAWLDLGSFAAAGRPAAAIVIKDSYRVRALFKETQLSRISAGDRAQITLMGWDGPPLEGVVAGVAPGIERLDETGQRHSTGLQRIQPTFDWVRLAQRIPVEIELLDPPPDAPLRVGGTASVSIHPGD